MKSGSKKRYAFYSFPSRKSCIWYF